MIESYITNTKLINKDSILDLDHIVNEYPYFATTQLLLTKGMNNIGSKAYNNQLKKAAAYAGNRIKLFNLITENIVDDTNRIQSTKGKEKLEIGKPLNFTTEEKYSFSEWLRLTKIKKINRVEKRDSNENLINKFITEGSLKNNNPNTLFFSPTKNARDSIKENHNIITETLAKVYLEQGHYNKAISAYEKLILKYPKKNIFFAKKIKLINKLKKL
ncbi:MAG: tetratricopeptide repeat protein [Bacteroidota bacterium]|nr:tetratricopeptide repeat protein [Bacteroidota bacterium]